MHRTFISNLKMAADRTAKSGLTLVLEPINHRDIPGYFTHTTDQVKQIIDEVGAPYVQMQATPEKLWHAIAAAKGNGKAT